VLVEFQDSYNYTIGGVAFINQHQASGQNGHVGVRDSRVHTKIRQPQGWVGKTISMGNYYMGK